MGLEWETGYIRPHHREDSILRRVEQRATELAICGTWPSRVSSPSERVFHIQKHCSFLCLLGSLSSSLIACMECLGFGAQQGCARNSRSCSFPHCSPSSIYFFVVSTVLPSCRNGQLRYHINSQTLFLRDNSGKREGLERGMKMIDQDLFDAPEISLKTWGSIFFPAHRIDIPLRGRLICEQSSPRPSLTGLTGVKMNQRTR